MTSVDGDAIQPVEIIVPRVANASLPAAPQNGTIFYDSTNDKLVVWTGAAYETIISS